MKPEPKQVKPIPEQKCGCIQYMDVDLAGPRTMPKPRYKMCGLHTAAPDLLEAAIRIVASLDAGIDADSIRASEKAVVAGTTDGRSALKDLRSAIA